MNQPKPYPRLERWLGYFIMPHELLHVLGYRLVGQRCVYRRGNSYVTPVGSMSRRARLVGKLFPFLVFFISLTIFAILAGFAVGPAKHEGDYLWLIFWLGLTYLAGFYTCTTLGDLRQAYLLIFDKAWYEWTPFDFFFWPVVDWTAIRRQVQAGEIDEQPD